MSDLTAKRWLTAIPLVYGENGAFWDRHCGLITQGLLKIGVESKFMALGQPEVRKDLPLILGRLNQWHQAEWWKQWRADGIIFNSWGAPRFEPVARAMKQSGARLIIRLDTGGVKSPRTHFFQFLKMTYGCARDTGSRFAALYAIAKTLVFRFVPPAYDHGMVRHFEHADRIIVESPLAQAIVARYLRSRGRADLIARLRMVPHPIKDDFRYDPKGPKAARVIAVGRFQSQQKDAPLLMRVLERTLPENPDYSVTIIGVQPNNLHRWHAQLPADVRQRVTLAGRLPHAELKRHYQEARIIIFTSHFEGCPVAGGEALAFGCSVVGPGSLPPLLYLAGDSSGTCSISRRTGDMCDALATEMELWRRGCRDPKRISETWYPRLAASSMAAQLIQL